MRVSKSLCALAALALSTLASPVVHAGFVTTSMDTSSPVMTFSIPSQGVNGESGYVGSNSVSYNGSDPFPAYCTDFFRSINVSDHYAAGPAPLSSLANSDFLLKLFTSDSALHDNSILEQAALQLAVWDVVESGRAGLGEYVDPLAYNPRQVDRGPDHFLVYEDSRKLTLLFGVSSSNLVVYDDNGTGVLNRVSQLLRTAENTVGSGGSLSYLAPDTSYGQGFVYFTPITHAVPEPSSIILSGIGLVGLLGLHFRRRVHCVVDR